MNGKHVRVVRVMAIIMGGIGFFGGFAAYMISTWHLQDAPLEESASTGEIYPYFIRGETIYLDSFNFAVETYLFPTMVVLCFLSMGLLSWVDRNKTEGPKF